MDNFIYAVRCKDEKQLDKIKKEAKIMSVASGYRIADIIEKALLKLKKEKEKE